LKGETVRDATMIHGYRQYRLAVVLLAGIALLLATLALVDGAHADPRKNLLILNSYSQGYQWTDDETRGAIETLAPLKNDLKLCIEYMGTKYASDEEYFEQLQRTLKQKFRSVRFDLIIAMDNDALAFLVEYRDEMFGRVPVVFCGVNYFSDDDLQGQPL
jgi:hypothetical protein